MAATSKYHIFIGILLSGAKAFFSATVSIVWGVASFFLFLGLATYYEIDKTAIQGLYPLMDFVMTNWIYFFWLIAIFEFITNIKEFLTPLEVKATLTTTKKKVEETKL